MTVIVDVPLPGAGMVEGVEVTDTPMEVPAQVERLIAELKPLRAEVVIVAEAVEPSAM